MITRDIELGAYLLCKGYKIEKIERLPRGHKPTQFVFAGDKDAIEAEVLNYYNKDGLVEAVSYATAMRHLKSLAHNKSN